MLINGLWKVYSTSDNNTVKQLAQNYSKGSAESCNVYNNNFSCKTAKGQGSMILGYWTAYQNTGNETYQIIAENLSNTNKSSPRIARALWKSYIQTGNKTYEENATQMTKKYIENCPKNCSGMELTDTYLAAWKGYRATGKYGYYRNALEVTTGYENRSCTPLTNNTSCRLPNIQGATTTAMWKTYRNQLDRKEKIFNPIISSNLSANGTIHVQTEIQGRIENPKIELPTKNTSCNLNTFNQSCKIDAEKIGGQNSFKYILKSNKSRFPKNGSFQIVTSFQNISYRNYSKKIISTDPENRCEPWNSTTKCETEYDQALMIQGFNSYTPLSNHSNYSKIRKNLSYKDWGANPLYSSDCKYYNNNFNCGSTSEIKGSFTQGKLINTYFNLYRKTGNLTALNIAKNYSKGSAVDCDIWNHNYNCGSSRGQGAIINAYWKAYKTTGNTTYLNIMKNLSSKGVEKDSDPLLGASLWKSYAITNNETYRDKAKNITENTTWESGILDFSATASAHRNSYIYGNSSKKEFSKLVDNGTEGESCNPINGDYNCSQPRQQGSLGSTYVEAFQTIPRELEAYLNMDAPGTITSGDSFSTSCTLENKKEDTVLYRSDIEFEASGEISKTSGANKNKTNLPFNSTVSDSAAFQASGSGNQQLTCKATTENNYKITETASVKVKNKKTEDSGGAGRGSSTSPIGSVPKPEFQPYRINYSFENISELEKDLKTVANLTKRDFSTNSTCFHGNRFIREEGSTLTIEHTCNTSDVLIVEKIPGNTSTETEHKLARGKAVYNLTNLSKETKKITYTNWGREENWTAPTPVRLKTLEKDEKPLKMNITYKEFNSTSSKAFIRFELNRESSCNVKNNTGAKSLGNVTEKRVKMGISPGNNTIKVQCGNIEKTFNKVIERKDQGLIPSEDIITLAKLVGGLITTLILIKLVVYSRKPIERKINRIIEDHRKEKLFSSINSKEEKSAIEEYEKLKQNSGNDTDLGVKLYISLEVIEDAQSKGIKIDKEEKIISDAKEYLEDNPEKSISQNIKEKISKIQE